MSIRECLDSAVAQKEISQAAADEIDLVFNKFVAQHALVHGDAEARRKALEQVATRLEVTAAHKRRVALLQATAIERTWNAMRGYKNARGEVDVAAALLEVLETHGRRDEGLGLGSLAGRQKAIFGAAVSEFETGLEQFGENVIGQRKGKASLENAVRELFGQGSGDPAAKAIAETFGRVAEGLRQRFNELGGAVRKLEKWGLPQSHDASALRRVGFEAWSDRIGKLLDWDEMRHALSGEPILPDERGEVLRHVFDTITTEGWNTRLPDTRNQGRGALWTQHSDHRFLKFKDADAWLSYQRDFGQGDPFATMMGHLKVMSRDIAAMQLLGPNPQATINWLKNEITREAQNVRAGQPGLVPRRREISGITKDAVDYANKTLHRADSMWASYSGASDVAVDTLVSGAFTTARNAVTATSLGSAILSAPSDLGFGAFARSFAAGMSTPGGLFHQAGVLVKAMVETVTGNEVSGRAAGLRAGIVFDHLASTFGERAREAHAVSGPVMTRFVADQVMRKQGLAAWTTTQKAGFGLWLMGEIGDEAGKGWRDVHAPVQRLLRRYGIGESEWDILRLASLHDLDADGGGATILRAREVAAMTVDDLGRLLVRDREGHLAAVQAIRTWEKDVYRLADDVREQIGSILTTARGTPNLTAAQIFGLMENVFGRLPAKLRTEFGNRNFTVGSMIKALEDLRDGTYAVSEIARSRWRESAEFEALPPWMRKVMDDPALSVGEAVQMLRRMAEKPARDRVEGFPSLPSDKVDDKIRRYFQDLSERYLEVILQETTYAVPEGTLRSKSFVSELKPGTFAGEMMRSMAQFKGFGFAVAQLHVGRVMHELAAGRVGLSSVPYAAGALAALGLLGMFSMQAKQLAKGEDVRDMSDWRNWAGAMAQSGGAGIYGDFFLADQNRFGGGLAATVAGPIVGRVDKLARATLGNVQQGADGKKTNAGREVSALVQSFDPLSSLWWSKLAWDRLAHSHLRRALDPEAAQEMYRREQVARRDRGTGFWWRPGDAAPDRLPEMGGRAR